VIFRRGPSDWTELIAWDIKTDEFEFGQWFRGRIYERRCDLSPDGKLLIYFARKINKRTQNSDYTYAWTAISMAPYLTALALWPKGDCWAGGGMFNSNQSVFLNHQPDRATPHPKHVPPKTLRVQANDTARGEDDPLYSMRLTRDGWVETQAMRTVYKNSPEHYVTTQPEVRVRKHPSKLFHVQMTRSLDRLKYNESFAVLKRDGTSVVDTLGVTWADWDQRGRLVLLKAGKLFVGTPDTAGTSFTVTELAEFNSHVPRSVVAPYWATHW
jgi:hypothetical protein